ncbi:MAG: hypothetical protein IJ113_01255 [Eggerthellaceae bacterium]|nr:hypothetical protein [Eggerthellaceae bacterium]
MPKVPSKRGSMHIKKKTQGTSNEISFSVLDAINEETPNTESNSPRTVSGLGKISVFTLPNKQGNDSVASASGFGMSRATRSKSKRAVGGTASLGPASEVMVRKQRRRVSKLLNIAAVLALLGILVFAGGRFFNSFMERQTQNQSAINEAISFLEQTDEAFVALDQAIAAPAQSDEASYNKILEDLNAAASLLDRAANSAETVVNARESDTMVEVASEVKTSALARKDLIEKGRTVLIQGAAAKTATELVEQAWETTLQSDAYVRDATVLAEDSSRANIEAANGLTTKALDGFQEALVLVRQAQSAYPRADLSSLEDYLETRSAAQQNALVSNASLLEGDRAAAEANSAAFNENEEAAAKIAASMPENPAQPIIDRYAEVGGASDAAYQDIRARVARADAAVREYRKL